MNEWKRVFSFKMRILIFTAIILNLGGFFFQQLEGRSLKQMSFSLNESAMLRERYATSELSAALEQITNENQLVSRYAKSQTDDGQKNIVNSESKKDTRFILDELDQNQLELIQQYQSLTTDEQSLYKLQMNNMKEKLKSLSSYEDKVESIEQNALKMKKINLFANKNSFAYHNILKTAEDFQRVKDVSVVLDNDLGVDKFVHYYFQYYIVAAIILMILYSFLKERENGIWKLVHISKNGRMQLAGKRFLITIGSSCIVLAAFYFSTFFFSMLLYGGWHDLSNPVQTLSDFDKFTYPMSKLDYILVLFAVSAAIMSALSVVVWAIFTTFRNRNHTLVWIALFVGCEVLLYQKISIQSVYNVFRYINVVSFLQINALFSTYLNWGFHLKVFSVFSITCAGLMLFAVICAIVAIIKYAHMRPEVGKTWIERFGDYLYQKYQKLFAKYPIILKEIHKLIITEKGVWVIFVIMLVAFYFSKTGTMNFSDLDKNMDQMYLEHGGSEYSYIIDYTNEKYSEYEEANSQLEEIQEQYEAGEIDMKTYASAINNARNKQYELARVKEFKDKEAYIDQIKDEYGMDVWMISDRGYEEIFGTFSRQREFILLITLIAGVLFIISESIAIEYRTGMEVIIRSCSNGRKWITRRKLVACILFTIVLVSIVYGIDFYNLYRIYGMPYLQAPALSLTFLKGTVVNVIPHITIMEWMFLRFLVRLIIALITMNIAIAISKLIAKKGSRAIMLIVLAIIISCVWMLQGVSNGL